MLGVELWVLMLWNSFKQNGQSWEKNNCENYFLKNALIVFVVL